MRINLGGEPGGIGADDGSLQLSGFAEEHGPIALAGKITGRTPEIENLADAVSALGWKLPGEWSIEGPASLDLLWNSPDRTSPAQLFGEIGLDGVEVRAPFLNLPVERVHGTLNLIGSAEELTVSSAEAFGGQWSGTIAVSAPDQDARFSLKTDRLNAEDLDRWLNPRWRQGFLGSVLPFLSAGGAEKIPSTLRVSGRLSIDSFAFSRYVVQHLSGNFALDQRQIAFRDADADFSGGKVTGSVTADLREAPVYKVSANFSDLNLAALAAGSPTLAHQFSGSATGEIELDMKGVGRDALVASLACRGRAAIQPASFTAFDLFDSIHAAARRSGTSTFSEVNGAFACHDDHIDLAGVHLRNGDTSLSASGTVDFARNADIHLQWMPRAKNQVHVGADPAIDAASYQLRGPLFAPRIERAETTPTE